jgi:hypothetical protein
LLAFPFNRRSLDHYGGTKRVPKRPQDGYAWAP